MKSCVTTACILMVSSTYAFSESHTWQVDRLKHMSIDLSGQETLDVKEFLKQMGAVLKKNMILDANVSGKLTIVAPRPMSPEEAYQMLLSSLQMLGMTTVETGKIIRVVRIRDASSSHIPTLTGMSLPPHTDQVVTQMVPLVYVQAQQVLPILNQWISDGKIFVYEPTNVLIITNSAYKVRRALELLQLLDVKDQQSSAEVIAIKHRSSKHILTQMNEFKGYESSVSRTSKSPVSGVHVLADEDRNALIVFGTSREITLLKQRIRQFDVPIEGDQKHLGKRFYVRPVEFNEAAKLAATLNALRINQPVLNTLRRNQASETTDQMQILSDESTNSLIILSEFQGYKSLDQLIRKLDGKKTQVLIEVLIAEINDEHGFKFAPSSLVGGGQASGTKTIVGWEAVGVAPLLRAGWSGGSGDERGREAFAEGFQDSLTIGLLSGTSVQVPGIGTLTPGAMLKLIQTDSFTSTLSSPYVLTANHEEAEVSVGDTLIFKTAEFSPVGHTVQTKLTKENVDLRIKLKPAVSVLDKISLSFELDAARITGLSSQGYPKVAKRKLKHSVHMQSGQTMFIAGMTNNSEYKTKKKIPILGDVPIVGWWFNQILSGANKTNLMIFLTPHAIHGSADLEALHRKQLAQRQEMLTKLYGAQTKESSFSSERYIESKGSQTSNLQDDGL